MNKNKFLNFPVIKNIYKFLSFQKNKNFIPFKLKSFLSPEKVYSDFFVYNCEFYKNVFIAENIYGLLNAKEMEVLHQFKFYSQEGNLFATKTYKSKKFISKIDLPKFNKEENYISFTHETLLTKSSKINILHLEGFKDLSSQHRGYTNYFKTKNSIGSIVHGNFGAISPSNTNNSASTLRSENYIYTPIYFFTPKNKYHLVFNNPTQKNLKINIEGKNKSNKYFLKEELSINSLGTKFLEVNNYEGKLSFISKLPICRCIIFKNPELFSQNNNFDVFHS